MIGRCPSFDCGQTIGSATFAYAQLINPVIEAETADHVEVVHSSSPNHLYYRTQDSGSNRVNIPELRNTLNYQDDKTIDITNSRFKRFGYGVSTAQYQSNGLQLSSQDPYVFRDVGLFKGNLVDNSTVRYTYLFNQFTRRWRECLVEQ